MKKKKIKKKKEFNVKGYIFGALRKIWRWHPVRRQILALAKVNGCNLVGDWFACAKCDQIFPKKQVQVDHIKPVIDPAAGFTTWDSVIEAMLNVTLDDVQILCFDCHRLKTNTENELRRKYGTGHTSRRK